MNHNERWYALSGVLLGLAVAGCSNDDTATGVTCGPGTILVDRQCRVTGVDPVDGGTDAASEADAGSPGNGGQGGNPNGGPPGEAGPPGMEAGNGPPNPPAPKSCNVGDGGVITGDPCPSGPVIDCSNTCNNGLPCPQHPHGCVWNSDDSASIQLDGTSVATIRTPEGNLPSGACAAQCGDAGADQTAYSFTVTSSHRWVKITAPAPWRVVAVGDDLCHPADNHCLLVRNGAMVLAPAACMPARNVLVEPITDTASCE